MRNIGRGGGAGIARAGGSVAVAAPRGRASSAAWRWKGDAGDDVTSAVPKQSDVSFDELERAAVTGSIAVRPLARPLPGPRTVVACPPPIAVRSTRSGRSSDTGTSGCSGPGRRCRSSAPGCSRWRRDGSRWSSRTAPFSSDSSHPIGSMPILLLFAAGGPARRPDAQAPARRHHADGDAAGGDGTVGDDVDPPHHDRMAARTRGAQRYRVGVRDPGPAVDDGGARGAGRSARRDRTELQRFQSGAGRWPGGWRGSHRGCRDRVVLRAQRSELPRGARSDWRSFVCRQSSCAGPRARHP